MPRPSGEKLLDAPIGECPLNGELLGHLNIDLVAGLYMEAKSRGLFTLAFGVKERQYLAARIHPRIQARDNGRNQRLWQVVERCPQQDHVEHAVGKVERTREKSLDIPDGISVLVSSLLPAAGPGVVFKVGEKDAVAQAGEVIDVGRRGKSGIDDAQARLALQPFAQRGPRARVARDTRPAQSRTGSSGELFLFSIE